MSNRNHKTLILTRFELEKIVRQVGMDALMDQLINRLENAIKEYDEKKVIIPARSGFNYKEPHPGLIEWMPLYNANNQVILKVVGYHPENPELYQMPSIISTLYSYNTESGHLDALMDGVLPTALRTGAASAIASKYLAKENSSNLGLIGCGAQSITQLHALSRVFNFEKIYLNDKDPKSLQSFSERIKVLDLQIEVIKCSIEEVVKNADILCTATSIDIGEGPLFKNLETKDHLHINAVGSDFPGKIEMPKELLEKALVCPDFLEQALIEGECQQLSEEQIGPSINIVVKDSGEYISYKSNLTVFDSTGWALQDTVIMDLFLEYAKKLKLGKLIEIESISRDVKNPYHFLDSLELKSNHLTLEEMEKLDVNSEKKNLFEKK